MDIQGGIGIQRCYNRSAELSKDTPRDSDELPRKIRIFRHDSDGKWDPNGESDRAADEGFPIELSYNGTAVIVQPTDWQWEEVNVVERDRVDSPMGRPIVLQRKLRMFKKSRHQLTGKPIASRKNHVDLPPDVVRWVFDNRNSESTGGALMTGHALGSEVGDLIATKQKDLDAVEARLSNREAEFKKAQTRAEAKAKDQLVDLDRQLEEKRRELEALGAGKRTAARK